MYLMLSYGPASAADSVHQQLQFPPHPICTANINMDSENFTQESCFMLWQNPAPVTCLWVAYNSGSLSCNL